jgi:DNA-binding Lrp family transcriptional regulator
MKRVKIDRIDVKILRGLQENGRETNVELAREAGISAPPCLRRVKALEEAGFIKGYHADIAAEKLGYGITVFCQISLSSHADADLSTFMKAVENWPLVRECYMLTGDADFLLKIVAEDLEAYQKFLTTQLTTHPNMGHVKSTPVFKRTKYLSGVPIDDSLLQGPTE